MPHATYPALLTLVACVAAPRPLPETLTFIAAEGFRAYAQLGHGDASGGGNGLRTGNIQVIIDGSAVLAGNSRKQLALLECGHYATFVP